MSGLDLADAERGVFAAIRDGGRSVVFDHEQVAASGAEVSASALETSGLGLSISIGGDGRGRQTLTICRVGGNVGAGNRNLEVSCLGVEGVGVPELAAGSELNRQIVIVFADGGLLALAAERPEGAEGHDEEELTAALAIPGEESLRPGEVLLSTEYDEHGRHRRATLELERGEGEPPMRGAGRLVCGTTLEAGGNRTDLAFFRWSLDGRAGLGRYEIVRRA